MERVVRPESSQGSDNAALAKQRYAGRKHGRHICEAARENGCQSKDDEEDEGKGWNGCAKQLVV